MMRVVRVRWVSPREGGGEQRRARRGALSLVGGGGDNLVQLQSVVAALWATSNT